MKVDSLEKFQAWVKFLCTAPEHRKPEFWNSDEDLREIQELPRLFTVNPELVLDNLEFIFEEVFGKIDEQNFWKYREYLRTNILDSEAVPYSLEVNPMHFMRVSLSDPTFISFTPDEKYGLADRQLKMKPGRFLARYTKMTNEEIKERVTEYNAKYVPPDLQIFTEVKDIIHVYRHGPRSCMTKDWNDSNHPVRLYGTSPQFGVLVIRPEGKANFSARAVAFYKQGKWTALRTYGDSQMMDRVFAMNKDILDTKTSLTEKIQGVFVRLEEVDRDRNNVTVIMPYIDIRGATLAQISQDWAIFSPESLFRSAHSEPDALSFQPTSGAIVIPKRSSYEYDADCSCTMCQFVRESHATLLADIPEAAELNILSEPTRTSTSERAESVQATAP